jgi:hypothetical protein
VAYKTGDEVEYLGSGDGLGVYGTLEDLRFEVVAHA